jgi:hypothetical protein
MPSLPSIDLRAMLETGASNSGIPGPRSHHSRRTRRQRRIQHSDMPAAVPDGAASARPHLLRSPLWTTIRRRVKLADRDHPHTIFLRIRHPSPTTRRKIHAAKLGRPWADLIFLRIRHPSPTTRRKIQAQARRATVNQGCSDLG